MITVRNIFEYSDSGLSLYKRIQNKVGVNVQSIERVEATVFNVMVNTPEEATLIEYNFNAILTLIDKEPV